MSTEPRDKPAVAPQSLANDDIGEQTTAAHVPHPGDDPRGRAARLRSVATFHSVQEGETFRGKLLGSVQLASGRFAMIDDGLGFSLVPWRPVKSLIRRSGARSLASCAAATFPSSWVEGGDAGWN
jgi:Protein of unknown function (DUF3363)